MTGQPAIIKNLITADKGRPIPALNDPIGFGRTRTNHMLVCDFDAQQGGWQIPKIVPYGAFDLSPDSLVFHYGQEVFEGMKAYRSSTNANEIYLFRPKENARRFFNSATRLGMEPVPEELFLRCIEEIVSIEKDWILPSPASLYIRPTLIATECGISYRASQSYRFFIIVSPAKNYYKSSSGVTVFVERDHVRAVPGGCGEAKCGGNYAAALPAMARAKAAGAEQVLWLDAIHRKFVEEVGAMNIMFVYGNTLKTPELSGSILPGITRNSILRLAKDLGFQVEETKIDISNVLQDILSGHLTEVFGCGTAAVISPVTHFVDGNKTFEVNSGAVGEVSKKIKQALIEIQFGTTPDPYGWRHIMPTF
jgi:branched-chain amino acid aminotransferase